ncbi:hypothetical protein ACKRZS_010151 [Fusarium odoratissimum]
MKKHNAQLAREWVEPPSSSSSSQPSPSLHQPPTPIAPAPETEFMEVDGELEAERAPDASQSAVAAESGIPVLNASSKRSFAPDAEIPDRGEERESAPRPPPHLRRSSRRKQL